MTKTPLYWIEGPWRGRIAIMPRPRGGDWLEDEVEGWHKEGVGVVLSALTSEEMEEFDLSREAEFCEQKRIEYINFPIADRGVPSSAASTAELVHRLESKLNEGDNIAIHCRQGIGRSSLLAACLLASAGVKSEEAFDRIAKARGCAVPDTVEQLQWVTQFEKSALAIGRRDH